MTTTEDGEVYHYNTSAHGTVTLDSIKQTLQNAAVKAQSGPVQVKFPGNETLYSVDDSILDNPKTLEALTYLIDDQIHENRYPIYRSYDAVPEGEKSFTEYRPQNISLEEALKEAQLQAQTGKPVLLMFNDNCLVVSETTDIKALEYAYFRAVRGGWKYDPAQGYSAARDTTWVDRVTNENPNPEMPPFS